MINLSTTRTVVNECQALIERLDGEELDERNALTSQSKGIARRRKANLSHDLQLLASRLEFAAQLVRNEYWFARGELDVLNPDREEIV